MYHSLGLPFLSPTINLFFSDGSFYLYISHLKEYSGVDLKEDEKLSAQKGYPIGTLSIPEYGIVQIHFLHYTSFAEAKQKWQERTKRINYSRIFLVIEAVDTHELSWIPKYISLPYEKAIFTKSENKPDKGVYKLNYYSRNPFSKPVTRFVSPLGKRGYDEFDFAGIIFHAK
jgi:uncharacterized protein (DUF1919 family)